MADCDDGDGGREARASVIKCVQQDDQRGRGLRAGGHERACVACAYFPLSFSLFCVLNFNEAAAAATRRAKLLRALLRKTAAVGRKGEGEEGEGRRAGLWYCTAAEYQKSPNLLKSRLKIS